VVQRSDGPEEPGHLVELRNGTRALIRPIGPADRDRLRRGFESASPDSIFLRFLAPLPRLPDSLLEYLTAIDHDRHEALIAVDPVTGESFGTARYVRSETDPASAEFAVGVGDRWMRIGLGTALLGSLAARARKAGIVRFTGLALESNLAIRSLVRKTLGPYTASPAGGGALELVVDLEWGRRDPNPRPRPLGERRPRA
jgi:GNAT superfamily N-acetyltransferase